MRALTLGILVLVAQSAWACGYCVEDKIASTYDHAVVTGALARNHHVVFFHIDGNLPAGEAARRSLEGLVRATAGVDSGTTRVSLDTATVSFAFDPARTSLASVQARLEKRLGAQGLSLMPLRIMEQPADLKTVKR
jgi:hypothetical protein